MASSSQALPPRALPSPSSAAPAPPPSRSTSLLCMLHTEHHTTVASAIDADDCGVAFHIRQRHPEPCSSRINFSGDPKLPLLCIADMDPSCGLLYPSQSAFAVYLPLIYLCKELQRQSHRHRKVTG